MKKNNIMMYISILSFIISWGLIILEIILETI